jgi:DNA-binding transcriptional MerR regulator
VAENDDLEAGCSGISSSLPDDDGPIPYSDTVGEHLLSIGEMARESGATPRALRFYEGKGLLFPERRGAARLYGPAERERLALVLKAKQLGFTLAEIRQMLGDKEAPVRALPISRTQCFEQIKMLEMRRREIEAALAELRRTYSSFYARLVGASV